MRIPGEKVTGTQRSWQQKAYLSSLKHNQFGESFKDCLWNKIVCEKTRIKVSGTKNLETFIFGI